MDEKLKPCPKCGAQPKHGYMGDEDGGYGYVECNQDDHNFVCHLDTEAEAIAAWNARAPSRNDVLEEAALFKLGDRVTKAKGSSWTGRVVGFYSTSLTPIGYAIESENEPGSVQIYPETAIRARKDQTDEQQ